MIVVTSIVDAYRKAFSGLPRLIWILAFGGLINRAGTMVLPFLALYLTRDLGLGVERAGILVATYGLGSVVGANLGGRLSDRIGAIRTQLLSLILSGAGFLALTQVTVFEPLAVSIFLVSVVSEAYRPAMMAAVALEAPVEVQARSFGLIRLAINLGMSAGPAVGGLLATISYSWLFVVDGLTCWASAAVLLLILGRRRMRPEPGITRGATSPWRDVPYVALLGVVFVLAIAFFQLWVTYPIYLGEAYGFSESAIGLLMGFNAALIVVFEMILMHRVEGYNPMKVAGIGAAITCGGMAVVPLGSAVWLAVASMATISFGQMLTFPIISAVVARRAGRASAGRYMGAYTMTFGSAFIFAPLLGTMVYGRLGPVWVWVGVGAVGLFTMVAHFRLGPFFSGGREESGTDTV